VGDLPGTRQLPAQGGDCPGRHGGDAQGARHRPGARRGGEGPHERLAERRDVVQRVVEEAQIGGQRHHPGIVPVHELGMVADERPCFTMQLVEGRTLAALLAEGESSRSGRGDLIEIFAAVCPTMASAHSRGVIHRETEPPPRPIADATRQMLLGLASEAAQVAVEGNPAGSRSGTRSAWRATAPATSRRLGRD